MDINVGDVLKLKKTTSLRKQRMGSTPRGSGFPTEMSGLWSPKIMIARKLLEKNVKEIVEKS